MDNLETNYDNLGLIDFKRAQDLNLDNTSFNSNTKFPALCEERYGKLQWLEISDLSKRHLYMYRHELSDTFINIYNTNQKLEKKCQTYQEEISKLLDNIDKKTLSKIMNEQKMQILNKWCPMCITYQEQGIEKCMHVQTCKGACSNCFSIQDEICTACEQIQLVSCPTCCQEKNLEQLCRSKNCSHYICWECRGRSFRAENEIYECPQCRVDLD